MNFLADFHVHSSHSRATSKNMTLESLYIAAQCKGISVVATGDFTHPVWIEEIREKLVSADNGLYQLKPDIAGICDKEVPSVCRGTVQFMLVTEISNIYKKNGRVRKIHNLIFIPEIEQAIKLNRKLEKIGNIGSDGRPILGLDARNLLELTLSVGDQAFLVPAHIWTPWFSMLGSKSGFDSILECFDDLSSHIFAVETGLSSDPIMNWRVSSLDQAVLISNSDAHSPSKLGREANQFDTELSFSAIRQALMNPSKKEFIGTIEFFPEEGKYHYDGHRKCQICLHPVETQQVNGICPVCGKPLTVGVLYRTHELADRKDGDRSPRHKPFFYSVPLTEILSEILNVGSSSKEVMKRYETALNRLGPELNIIASMSLDEIRSANIPLLAEAIQKIRQNDIHISPGYDGEFGKIRLFSPEERQMLFNQHKLFLVMDSKISSDLSSDESDLIEKPVFLKKKLQTVTEKGPPTVVNLEQENAIGHDTGPMIIIAGPGTGKTRTITHKMARLVIQKNVIADHILALTFTNKAADEMRNRIRQLLPSERILPVIETFHSLCLRVLTDHHIQSTVIDEPERMAVIADAINQNVQNGIFMKKNSAWIAEQIRAIKQKWSKTNDFSNVCKQNDLARIIKAYQHLMHIQGLVDYEDIIQIAIRLIENDVTLKNDYAGLFRHVFVDEYQDLNAAQYRLLTLLAPPEKINGSVCVIGDPDQSIYGFSGADVTLFNRFIQEYSNARVFTLSQNYRSTENILAASFQVIQRAENIFDHPISNDMRHPLHSGITGSDLINIWKFETDDSEAAGIAVGIEKLTGGTGFFSIDSGRVDGNLPESHIGFGDIAILYRTSRQGERIADTLKSRGIPYRVAKKEMDVIQKFFSDVFAVLRFMEGSGSFQDSDICFRYINDGKKPLFFNRFKQICVQHDWSASDGLNQFEPASYDDLKPSFRSSYSKIMNKMILFKNEMEKMTLEQKLLFLISKAIHPNQINPSEYQKALDDLIEKAKNQSGRITDFLNGLSLQTDADMVNMKSEKVTLMTMHASKGTEFSVVFISGCEDGLIPYQKPGADNMDTEEERRLFYVAMTRAKEKLYCTWSLKRKLYGKMRLNRISPFLDQIDTSIVNQCVFRKPEKKNIKQNQIALF
jgi:uncharacterized protein (TIGR00375 family)